MKPVTDLYSSECPLCGGQKRVRFSVLQEFRPGEKIVSTEEAQWGDRPSFENGIIECFCSRCGIKFIYPF